MHGLYYTGGQDLMKLDTWIREHTWIVYYCYDLLNPSGSLKHLWDVEQEQSIGDVFWPVEGSWSRPAVGYSASQLADSKAAPRNPYRRSTNMSRMPLGLLDNVDQPSPTLERLARRLAQMDGASLTPLFFTTLATRFTIKAFQNSYLRVGSVDPAWDARGRLIFMLYANPSHYHESYAEDNPCGYVLLDDSFNTPDYDLSEQHFLLMSEANSDYQYGAPHARHKYKKFYGEDDWEEMHVMMVRHREVRDGVNVTERLGIGRVLREVVLDPARVQVVDVALV